MLWCANQAIITVASTVRSQDWKIGMSNIFLALFSLRLQSLLQLVPLNKSVPFRSLLLYCILLYCSEMYHPLLTPLTSLFDESMNPQITRSSGGSRDNIRMFSSKECPVALRTLALLPGASKFLISQ